MRASALILASQFLLAGVVAAEPARAACELATITTCTVMDPAAAETLLLKELAAKSTPRLLGQLAEFYRTAPKTFQDRERGLWYLRRASNAGDTDSMLAYADALINGDAVRTDPETALMILERASKLGARTAALVAMANYHLGVGDTDAARAALSQAPADDPRVRAVLVTIDPNAAKPAPRRAPVAAATAKSRTARDGESSTASGGLIDPPSTLTGRMLTIDETMEFAYEAGFHREEQVLAMVGMAIAESGLWTAARNWKPNQGYRPASDVIGVEGPPEAWSPDHHQQMHSDRGVWQISSVWWRQYPDTATDDPEQAAQAAYRASKRGTDFLAWDSFASGRAQRHYDEPYDGWPSLRPLVKAFLKGKASTTESASPEPSDE
jgi:hypothetical protein